MVYGVLDDDQSEVFLWDHGIDLQNKPDHGSEQRLGLICDPEIYRYGLFCSGT